MKKESSRLLFRAGITRLCGLSLNALFMASIGTKVLLLFNDSATAGVGSVAETADSDDLVDMMALFVLRDVELIHLPAQHVLLLCTAARNKRIDPKIDVIFDKILKSVC